MKLSKLFEQKKCVFSLEVFPPKKSSTVDTIYTTLEGLKEIKPDFISVTYGAGGNLADNSTCEIASIIKEKYKIEPLAHLTCVNSSKDEVLTVLKRLKEHGIENVLALRGDINPDLPPKDAFGHANELIEVVQAFGGFHVAAACYPEGHPQSVSLDEDIEAVKRKVEAGATHLMTQLFFDNNDFYKFMYKLRSAGVTVPVQAGIMPVVNARQIRRITSLCGASLPKKFMGIMSKFEHNEQAMRDAGIAYAIEQIVDLVTNAAQGIHLYTMNNPLIANRINDNIRSIIDAVNEQS